MLRHRDAWAVEAKAPTKDAWEKELAENPQEEEVAKPAAPRRVVAEPASSAPVEKDMLIVVSKMKKYIKDRSGFNCGDAVADVLSDHVRALCDEAIRNAGQDERKTVLDRDVPKPLRR